jgi:hypothetical protein
MLFWKRRNKQEPELNKIVRELAEYLLQPEKRDQFKSQAKALAKRVSISQLSDLKALFHTPPKESPLYSYKEHGLGGWLSSCQFAIFELIYNLGEESIPLVREIAWGEYDWTQGNAIELLIRFASEGIKTNEIVEEIKENYPKIRIEAQLYAIQPLIPQVKENQNLNNVFEKLMKIPDFRDAYEEITDTSA